MSKRLNNPHKLLHRVGKLFFSPEYVPCGVTEFPIQVDNGVIYIVREGDVPDTLIFKCPCGCDDVIYLNLLTDTWPCWKFKINRVGLISIVPSVRRKLKCKSHFYITKGTVISCSDFSTYYK